MKCDELLRVLTAPSYLIPIDVCAYQRGASCAKAYNWIFTLLSVSQWIHFFFNLLLNVVAKEQITQYSYWE